jgi:tetratricopeptide (TPR) repeat protein
MEKFFAFIIVFFLIIVNIFSQQSAYDFMALGKSASENNNCKQALVYYDKAISLNKFYYDAYLAKADCYLSMNNKKEALNQINQVLTIKKDYAPALYMRAELYINDKMYREAINDLKEVISQNKYFYPAHSLIVEAYIYLKDFNNALNEINFLISERPNEYDYLLKRAYIYKNLNQYDNAIKDCNTLINKGNLIGEAYALKGNINLELMKNNEAFIDYSMAINNNFHTQEMLATYLDMALKENKLAEAQHALELLIKNYEQKNSYYHMLLGKILIDQKYYESAINSLNTAISLRPNYDSAYVYRAMAKRLIDKDPQNDIRRAIYLNSKNALAYEELGIYYINKKLYSQALENLNTAIKLDPSGRAYYYRAIVWDINGDRASACADLQQAVKLEYKDAKVSYDKICH